MTTYKINNNKSKNAGIARFNVFKTQEQIEEVDKIA